MTESGWVLGLPLLTKDLIEQAARRRTYVLRVVYAVILYAAALWVYADIAGSGARGGITNLGRGRELFTMLVNAQMLAIVVLLPAICCGAIASEKERDTLGLLLLTRLSPATIILEKLISRLATMGTYQLLSLPLFAVVYGLGGVELAEMIAAVWLLALCSAVIGAISIYWSTWHSTTAGAFISTYVTMPVMAGIGAAFLDAIGRHRNFGPRPIGEMTGSMVAASALLLGVTAVCVIRAQNQLLERAFVPPRNLLLEQFRKLDAFFEELNQQTTRGIVLVRDQATGPVFDPVAWRETRKKSLGTVRYLFRFLVVLEVPLVLAIGWVAVDTQRQSFDGPTAFFLAVLWPVAAAAVAIHTINVLASERSRQTLDVLLVTPLSSRELLSQKLAGVRRLIGVLQVPFATLLIFQAVWTLYVIRGLDVFLRTSREGMVFLHEAAGMAFALIVYPRVIQWIAFHLVLRLTNQTQAVLTSLAAVVAFCGLPYVVGYLLAIGQPFSTRDLLIEWVTWCSPVRVLFHRQIVSAPDGALVSDARFDGLFVGLGLHAAAYIGLWIELRRRAVRGFSVCLGRAEPPGGAV